MGKTFCGLIFLAFLLFGCSEDPDKVAELEIRIIELEKENAQLYSRTHLLASTMKLWSNSITRDVGVDEAILALYRHLDLRLEEGDLRIEQGHPYFKPRFDLIPQSVLIK